MYTDAEFAKLQRAFLLEMARAIERKMLEVGVPAIFGLEVARSYGLVAGACTAVFLALVIHRAQVVACLDK